MTASSFGLAVLFYFNDHYKIENIKQNYKIYPTVLIIPLFLFLIKLTLGITFIIHINQQILARESNFDLIYKEKDVEKSCRIMRKYEKKIICQIDGQNSKITSIIDIEKLDSYQIQSKNDN